jgi:hypothetical protein
MREPATELLDLLWERYAAQVPYARAWQDLAGESFRNDHVAFRSLARPGGGIELLARPFEALGWQRRERYQFPDAHLRAVYLAQAGLPRVFVSELEPPGLPAQAQRILAALPPDPPPPQTGDLVALARWFDGPDVPPREDDLVALEPHTQYGAWLLAFGRRVNHFTAAVDDIEEAVRRMRAAGVPMKAEIEGEPGNRLRQTATLAHPAPVRLSGGRTRNWPYAYFEIAERRAGFDGFLAPQARALFEMTRRGA